MGAAAAAGFHLAAGEPIDAARRRLAAMLARSGFETPALDARILIGHALGLDHAGVIREGARALTEAEAEAVATLAARRLAFEPVARITGVKEFWSLPLAVNAATLVPRPETETVVEAALAWADAYGGRAKPLRILDIGVGSGALLLALLTEFPHGFGVGVDLSGPALATAHSNAQRLGLGARSGFVAGDFATALRGPFDLIVSNPPYVAAGAIARLAPGVRDYEPRSALDGGPDGLDAYRTIAAQVGSILAGAGLLVLEIGAGQAADVTAIFSRNGLVTCAIHPDLTGMPRALSLARA